MAADDVTHHSVLISNQIHSLHSVMLQRSTKNSELYHQDAVTL